MVSSTSGKTSSTFSSSGYRDYPPNWESSSPSRSPSPARPLRIGIPAPLQASKAQPAGKGKSVAASSSSSSSGSPDWKSGPGAGPSGTKHGHSPRSLKTSFKSVKTAVAGCCSRRE
ncbi:unnamed protein product [Sympodiomycopsis kandeliae]